MNPDLRLNVHVGVVLPIPGLNIGVIKPDIEIQGLDPNGDVEAQVTLALEKAAYAMARMDEQLEVVMTDMLSPETGSPGYRERLEEAERSISAVKQRLNEVIVRLRENSQTLTQLVGSQPSPEQDAPVEQQ